MSDIVNIRRLERLEREVAELKSEIGRTPLRIEMPRPPLVPAGADIKIFKVNSNATGDAVYYCREQVVTDADWDETNGSAKIWDIEVTWETGHSYQFGDEVMGTDSNFYECIEDHTSTNDDCPITGENWDTYWAEVVGIEVLNLDEHNPEAGQHNLAEGNILVAWEATDDEGTKRWIGVPAIEADTGTEFRIFKVKSDAQGDAVYYCREQVVTNADWDETNGSVKIWDIEVTWEVDHSYQFSDEVMGTDSNFYECIEDHTSTNDDCPITGENWDTYWVEVVGIEVLNLKEHNPEPGQHNLAEDDILIAWEVTDDNGTKRWVGVPVKKEIHKAFCKSDSQAATYMYCYLDVADTGDTIQVYCTIADGGNLDQATPHLTEGLEIPVWKDGDTWKCFWGFQHWPPCGT